MEYIFLKDLYVKTQACFLVTHKSCFHYGMQTSVEFKSVCKKIKVMEWFMKKTRGLTLGGISVGLLI